MFLRLFDKHNYYYFMKQIYFIKTTLLKSKFNEIPENVIQTFIREE